MDCARISFTGHAIRRMFERSFGRDAILEVVASGEIIAEYPDDTPYPSCLILGFVSGAPVHVVVAHEPEHRTCFVVTVYAPDPGMWSDDFKTRR